MLSPWLVGLTFLLESHYADKFSTQCLTRDWGGSIVCIMTSEMLFFIRESQHQSMKFVERQKHRYEFVCSISSLSSTYCRKLELYSRWCVCEILTLLPHPGPSLTPTHQTNCYNKSSNAFSQAFNMLRCAIRVQISSTITAANRQIRSYQVHLWLVQYLTMNYMHWY